MRQQRKSKIEREGHMHTERERERETEREKERETERFSNENWANFDKTFTRSYYLLRMLQRTLNLLKALNNGKMVDGFDLCLNQR